jgi:hypothetical protein
MAAALPVDPSVQDNGIAVAKSVAETGHQPGTESNHAKSESYQRKKPNTYRTLALDKNVPLIPVSQVLNLYNTRPKRRPRVR